MVVGVSDEPLKVAPSSCSPRRPHCKNIPTEVTSSVGKQLNRARDFSQCRPLKQRAYPKGNIIRLNSVAIVFTVPM